MLNKEMQINTKEKLKEVLRLEKARYKYGKIRFINYCEGNILKKFVSLLRKTEYYTNTNHKILAKFYSIRLGILENKYCLHIPINCCAKGLKIMHVGPILINDKAKIGENCVLHINTSIVAGGTNGEAPVIGDNCILGVGATVSGNVHLPNYTVVGANAFVNKSFYEESIAIAGVPAKKISNNGSGSWNNNVKSSSDGVEL